MGEIDPYEMLGKIDHQRFIEWMAYSEIEPWDETREDWRNAHVVAAMYNIHTRKPGAPVHPLGKFLLEFETRPKNTWQQNKANLLQHLMVAQEATKKVH